MAGDKAIHLGIIKFKSVPEVFTPIHMVKMEDKQEIQDILAEHAEVFQGIGKLLNHKVKIHVNKDVKPVAEPPRRIPYHLKSHVDEAVIDMVKNDVIEEHSI